MVGGGWRPTLGEWTWCYCWVPLQGAIVVCYGGGKVTANFGGVDVVPLLGASVMRYGCGGGWRPNTKIGFCYLGSMLVYFFLTRISICRAIVNTKIQLVKKQIAKPSWSFGASNIVLSVSSSQKIDGKSFCTSWCLMPCTLPPSHR